jgi:hypothetical protein
MKETLKVSGRREGEEKGGRGERRNGNVMDKNKGNVGSRLIKRKIRQENGNELNERKMIKIRE